MSELNDLARVDLSAVNYIDCHRWMAAFLDTGAMYPPENDPLDEFNLDNYTPEDVASLFIHRNYMICQDCLGPFAFNAYITQHLHNMDKE